MTLTEVVHTPSSPQLGFEPMSSRSWQCISCPWDNPSVYSLPWCKECLVLTPSSHKMWMNWMKTYSGCFFLHASIFWFFRTRCFNAFNFGSLAHGTRSCARYGKELLNTNIRSAKESCKKRDIYLMRQTYTGCFFTQASILGFCSTRCFRTFSFGSFAQLTLRRARDLAGKLLLDTNIRSAKVS